MKLILKKEPDQPDDYDSTSVTMETVCLTNLDQALELLNEFLRACGFHYSGHLVIDDYDCDSKDLDEK